MNFLWGNHWHENKWCYWDKYIWRAPLSSSIDCFCIHVICDVMCWFATKPFLIFTDDLHHLETPPPSFITYHRNLPSLPQLRVQILHINLSLLSQIKHVVGTVDESRRINVIDTIKMCHTPSRHWKTQWNISYPLTYLKISLPYFTPSNASHRSNIYWGGY